MTHVCVNKLTIIGSDNGLSPGRHQAIIEINAWILLIRSTGTIEILIEIHTFSFKKMHLKVWKMSMSFCLDFGVLKYNVSIITTRRPLVYGYHGKEITRFARWFCRRNRNIVFTPGIDRRLHWLSSLYFLWVIAPDIPQGGRIVREVITLSISYIAVVHKTYEILR